MTKQMVERRVHAHAAVWVVESQAEKKIIEQMLRDEQLMRPNEVVSVKRVFTNPKGQRAVQFSYSKKESSKPKSKDPFIQKIEKVILDIKLDKLKRDARRLIKK